MTPSQNQPPTQPITPENHPGEYGGALTVGDQQFSFVTGGGGRGSSPPGDHEITGYRTSGAFAGKGGAFTVADVYDPKVGDTRSAVEIHPSSRGATAGCFGVPAGQWPGFQAECQKVLDANGGKAYLHVDSNGNARIDGNPTGANATQQGAGAGAVTVGMSGVGWKDDDPHGADQIHQYLASGGHGLPRGENWCAAWLSATLNHAGIPDIKGDAGNIASNYATYGTPVDAKDVQPGDIMVGGMEGRQPGERGAHVAIVTGVSGGKVQLVEGDQRNDVTTYLTQPGSVYSKVSTGPAYTGGHGIATKSIDPSASGLIFRRPPAPVGGAAPGMSSAGTPLAAGCDYGARVMNIESTGGRTSLNLYQFQPGTWQQFGAKYGSITDPTAQARAFADLTNSNRAALTAGLGRPPTDGELYLAHQQGSAGALALIKNPSTPAGQLVPAANIIGNKGDPNAPASAFVNMWTSRFGGGGAAPSSVISANGVPFTAEQIRQNPYLLSASLNAIAGDANTRQKAMDAYGSGIETSINNFSVPAPETMAAYHQLALGNPSESPSGTHRRRCAGAPRAAGRWGRCRRRLRPWHRAKRRRIGDLSATGWHTGGGQ